MLVCCRVCCLFALFSRIIMSKLVAASRKALPASPSAQMYQSPSKAGMSKSMMQYLGQNSANKRKVVDLLREASRLESNGDLENAIRLFENSFAIVPDENIEVKFSYMFIRL